VFQYDNCYWRVSEASGTLSGVYKLGVTKTRTGPDTHGLA